MEECTRLSRRLPVSSGQREQGVAQCVWYVCSYTGLNVKLGIELLLTEPSPGNEHPTQERDRKLTYIKAFGAHQSTTDNVANNNLPSLI